MSIFNKLQSQKITIKYLDEEEMDQIKSEKNNRI